MRAACWPSTAGSARAPSASRRPRLPRPPGSRGRTGSSGRARPGATAAPTTIPARMNRSTGTLTPNTSTRSLGSTGGCGFEAVPNESSIAACSVSRTPSDAASFASGEAACSGLKARSSISDAEDDDDHERDHERGDRRHVGAEGARPERPERVAGEHGDRSGGQVDHARAAVEEHDAERDARDQRSRSQPQECEEEDLIQRHLVCSGGAGPAPVAGPADRVKLDCLSA